MNSETNPLVSVLMTAYNREKYIAEAIESVLASTYTNFELVIVDDCSSDNTVTIAKSYEAKDKRVKVYINEKNLGDYPNRNRAASYANGLYIKYLDSDDIIYPWGLEAMVYCMEVFPEAAFGLMIRSSQLNQPFPVFLLPEDAYRNFYFKGELIGMGPTGSIIKKKLFDEIGGFSGEPYVGDTGLWYALASKSSLVCLPPGLIWWREHEEQQIKSELKDNSIKAMRFNLSVSSLESDICPLNKTNSLMALRNVKNLYCRNILSQITKGNAKSAAQLLKMGKVSLYDVLLSLKRNKYPSG